MRNKLDVDVEWQRVRSSYISKRKTGHGQPKKKVFVLRTMECSSVDDTSTTMLRYLIKRMFYETTMAWATFKPFSTRTKRSADAMVFFYWRSYLFTGCKAHISSLRQMSWRRRIRRRRRSRHLVVNGWLVNLKIWYEIRSGVGLWISVNLLKKEIERIMDY